MEGDGREGDRSDGDGSEGDGREQCRGKVMGAKGTKAPGRQHSQEMGGKSDMLMGERGRWTTCCQVTQLQDRMRWKGSDARRVIGSDRGGEEEN